LEYDVLVEPQGYLKHVWPGATPQLVCSSELEQLCPDEALDRR
jgi:hypothetical protein